MTRFLALCLLLPACARQPAQCPPAERGAWAVAEVGETDDGTPRLIIDSFCTELPDGLANEAECRRRAKGMNAELKAVGDPQMFFVLWDEE